jgi:hypothetical protein
LADGAGGTEQGDPGHDGFLLRMGEVAAMEPVCGSTWIKKIA